MPSSKNVYWYTDFVQVSRILNVNLIDFLHVGRFSEVLKTIKIFFTTY